MSSGEEAKWTQKQGKFDRVKMILMRLRIEENPIKVLRYCYDGLKQFPNHAALLDRQEQALTFARDAINNSTTEVENFFIETNYLIQQQPDFGTAWLIRSWALIKKNNWHEAIINGEKFVRLNPNSAEAQDNMGFLLLKTGQIDKSIPYFQKAVNLKPDKAVYIWNLGTAYFIKGQTKKAVDLLISASGIQPENAYWHFILADVYFKQGKISEAQDEYYKSIRLNSNFKGLNKELESTLLKR